MLSLSSIRRRFLPSLPLLNFYIAFVIFCIGDRVWSFANAFFFELLGGMRLVSADQFMESGAVMLASGWVGSWLDRHNRRLGALTVQMVTNLGLVVSALLLGACLVFNGGVKQSTTAGSGGSSAMLIPEWLFIGCLTLSIVSSALTKCAGEGQRLVFTKDWVVVMAKHCCGQPSTDKDKDNNDINKHRIEQSLAKRNSAMVVIDQFASMVGPLLTGFLLAWFGYRMACAAIILWNVLSLVATRLLLSNVYENVPGLATREEKVSVESISAADCPNNFQQQKQKNLDEVQQKDSRKNAEKDGIKEEKNDHKKQQKKQQQQSTFNYAAQIRVYYRQRVFPAAFGLALLYMTVLGFDGLAVGFGKMQGMRDDMLGVFRSVSSVLGLLGAVSFTPIAGQVGVRKTGLVGLTLQHVTLWLCVLSILLPGSPFDPIGYFRQWTFQSWLHSSHSELAVENNNNVTTSPLSLSTPTPSAIDELVVIGGEPSKSTSILVFFIGLTLSRYGLWMADLAIVQLMQLDIPEADRGTVFGVQNGFCMLFSMLKDVLVILLPDQRTFGLLIGMSIVCVGIGFVQYIHYLIAVKAKSNEPRNVDEGEKR